MKNIFKSVALLTIISVIPGAFAATSRVGVSGPNVRTAGVRSIAGMLTSSSSLGLTTYTTGASSLDKQDCIDTYTDCIKGGDACGSDMEECTTNVLFHGKMGKCLNALSQCKADGIEALFGSGARETNLSGVATYTDATKNLAAEKREVARYTYPTDSSMLGQMIISAKIDNQLPTDQCVKKYTKCLQKDSVCGEDFELCTGNKEFKQNAIACASTLARCQNEGRVELFGSYAASESLVPDSKSRLREMILSGGEMAAKNAVATCYRVTDQCILNACAKNPNKCIEGIDEKLIRIADAYNGGRAVSEKDVIAMDNYLNGLAKREVNKFLENSCQDTIATNKYCYMVAKGKSVDETKLAGLSDDEKEEVFSDIYSGTDGMNGRYAKLQDQIIQLWDEFNASTQEKCVDTIAACAMRSCGGGIGSVCYTQAANSSGVVHVNGTGTYDVIKNSCEAIVGTEAACQYSARFAQTESNLPEKLRGIKPLDFTIKPFVSNKDNQSVFAMLFPTLASNSDPIGVVGVLNSTLASSYNSAAIAEMKRQCANTAISCVASMCGKDYTNCYRNRTDVIAGTYGTNDNGFNKSMNKMGGVLDYNIVMGLCLNTVKNSASCEEHLKIAAASVLDKETKDTASWGYKDGEETKQYSSVRQGWLGANDTSATLIESTKKQKLVGCVGSKEQEEINQECDTYTVMKCGTIDENKCSYDQKKYIEFGEYALSHAGETLFQEVLADIEREAQAKYNAKLNKEQNVCVNNDSNKGIMGASDNGSTFMWVKLKSSKVPKDYPMKGLQPKQFLASNDLYGSFCRARITVMSDDKDIQDVLGDEATAYFAVGDAFTCGSWISQNKLDEISKKVGERAAKKAGKGTSKEASSYAWAAVAGLLGGGAIGTGLTESGALKGLIEKSNLKNSADSSTKNKYKETCKNNVESAITEARKYSVGDLLSKYPMAETYASRAYDACRALDISAANGCKRVSLDSQDSGETVSTSSSGFTIDDTNKLISKIKGIGQGSLSGSVRVSRGTTDALKGKCYINGTLAGDVSDCGVTFDDSVNSATVYYTKSNPVITESAVSSFESGLNDMKAACENVSDDSKMSDGSAKAMRIAVPIVTAAAGTALATGITASVLKGKYEKASNEAIEEWMSEIGDHITCYLGGEELGNYGDVVTFEIQ